MKKNISFNNFSAQLSGVLLALGATIIWSGNFIISRGIHDIIPPVTLSTLRWLVAFVVIFPFSIKYFLNDLASIKQNFRYILLTSFLGITLFNTLVYIAGHSTDAINLSLIAITTPVFIIIFSRIFYKEKISLISISGIALTLSGVIMLICKGSITALLNISFSAGDFWMLAAAITFSLYSLLLRKKPVGISTMSFLFITFGIGLIMLIPFFLYETAAYPKVFVNPVVVISVLYAGIFASIGGFFMWSKAVELIGASESGLIYYSLPLFSTLWAILILGEKIRPIHFISLILIITGIVIATKNKKELIAAEP